MTSRPRIVGFALLGLALFTHVETAAAQPILRSYPWGAEFVFGINLPWFDGQFGHDLGPEPSRPQDKVWYDSAKVTTYFADIKQIGFRVVRVWLMERCEGLILDENGYIVGLSETFLQNLDDLVQRADQEKLRLYLCLQTSWDQVNYPSPVADERQQLAFLEIAVKPITKRLEGKPAIFAIDVFNEIESEYNPKCRHRVAVPQAQRFIYNNVRAIKSVDPRRLVSSGSMTSDTIKHGFYRNMGLDFYDFHIYNDQGHLPDLHELNADKPVIVGEFGSKTKGEDDEFQVKVVTSFMHSALQKGYAGCFVWTYGPMDPCFHIVRENGEHRPVVPYLEKIISTHFIAK